MPKPAYSSTQSEQVRPLGADRPDETVRGHDIEAAHVVGGEPVARRKPHPAAEVEPTTPTPDEEPLSVPACSRGGSITCPRRRRRRPGRRKRFDDPAHPAGHQTPPSICLQRPWPVAWLATRRPCPAAHAP
jgi:hypothetical protein